MKLAIVDGQRREAYPSLTCQWAFKSEPPWALTHQEQRLNEVDKERHALMSIMYSSDDQQDMALDRRTGTISS